MTALFHDIIFGNFALDGEATASTVSRDPANAIDGNDGTLWVGDGGIQISGVSE